MSVTKDMKQLIRITQAQGWDVQLSKNNHYRLVPPNPDLPIVIVPSTPSDYRSYKNTVALLRKSGLGV